jgi:hypothetical protein
MTQDEFNSLWKEMPACEQGMVLLENWYETDAGALDLLPFLQTIWNRRCASIRMWSCLCAIDTYAESASNCIVMVHAELSKQHWAFHRHTGTPLNLRLFAPCGRLSAETMLLLIHHLAEFHGTGGSTTVERLAV